ncbi:SixA phosphatase family protein [Aestuariivivens sediminicola]|uniref:SixA phosphatase family protein n=1 Tax=Aestuariivivens sediminicola TaxID=2913560 RepID=UPI001F59B890|nr:histidine phosphatase family protein [Aestuariivivens sediminicola]
MKTLILIRHAKSSWEFDVIDHERPLNKRGYKDSKLVSEYVAERNLRPDLVLVSDATRTRLTADAFIRALPISLEKVQYNHDLYDFSGHNLTKVIKHCPDAINQLMVFGHNHAITAFVNTYGSKYIDNVPTCGVVIIDFDIPNWKSLKQGITREVIFPKHLKS